MFFVYVIHSQVKEYKYTGLTNNLVRRISEHNLGYNKSTCPFKPFKLIYYEICKSRKEARIREKYLKSGSGREFIKKNCRSGVMVAALDSKSSIARCESSSLSSGTKRHMM